MALVVAKFGGSILSSGSGFRQLAETVSKLRSGGSSVVVVVSAMKGVTDTLLEVCRAASGWEEKLKGVMEAYYTAAKEAVSSQLLPEALSKLSMAFDELLKLVWASKVVGEVTPHTIASIVSFGERLSSIVAAYALRSAGLDSEWVDTRSLGIVGSGDPFEATVDYEESMPRVRASLQPLLSRDAIPVVPGFAGVTREGRVVLLGRGGSDYTATLIARFLDASEVHLYTDVDGLKTADPRLVPDAEHVDVLSTGEAVELALLGAKRMHPRTFEPIHGTRVRAVITRPGAARRTLIVDWEEGPPVKALAAVRGLALVSVEGAGLAGRVGVAARVMEAAASIGASLRVIAQPVSETRISVVVDSKYAEKLASTISERLGWLGVHVEARPVAAVAVVGYGLRDPSIAGEVLSKASRGKVLGAVWSPGSPSLTLLVPEQALAEEARRLHREVVLPWWRS